MWLYPKKNSFTCVRAEEERERENSRNKAGKYIVRDKEELWEERIIRCLKKNKTKKSRNEKQVCRKRKE